MSLFPAEIETLARQIIEEFSARGHMIATAESCTGGLIAGVLTEIAGSSAVVDRGFVTYTNRAKTGLLGVPVSVIERAGAVSEPVAALMADGALVRSAATVAVAVTGIAGPGGGSKAKPVGTVCFAWAGGGRPTRTERCHFSGSRREIRERSVRHALAGIVAQLGDR